MSKEIFVPGRVCLFGEHSDWAGGYRKINSNIEPGQVIITGTNQGMFAKINYSEDLVIKSTLPSGEEKRIIIPMKEDILLAVAQNDPFVCYSDQFFSYAAGVAYYMLINYKITGGVKIDNYKTTLPVKKGLSSSAAFCVLVARAFKEIYDLKMNTQAEMEAAYQGEILTSSQCGRMDQGCAFGQIPVQMTFDCDRLNITPIKVKKDIHLLFADLNGKKDTVKILDNLNRCYPYPKSELDKHVHDYLGQINTKITNKAVKALEDGNPIVLGELMNKSQRLFDSHVAAACPSELLAPKLHEVLEDDMVQQYIFGGKGVGSQGDGCVQFVTRNKKDRNQLKVYLKDQYDMDSFELDLCNK